MPCSQLASPFFSLKRSSVSHSDSVHSLIKRNVLNVAQPRRKKLYYNGPCSILRSVTSCFAKENERFSLHSASLSNSFRVFELQSLEENSREGGAYQLCRFQEDNRILRSLRKISLRSLQLHKFLQRKSIHPTTPSNQIQCQLAVHKKSNLLSQKLMRSFERKSKFKRMRGDIALTFFPFSQPFLASEALQTPFSQPHLPSFA